MSAAGERADRHRGEEQADDLGAGVELRRGEDREQRSRHPEGHRDEVDEEDALQDPPPTAGTGSPATIAAHPEVASGSRLARLAGTGGPGAAAAADISAAAPIVAAKLTTSIPYAQARPTRPTMIPPSAGPTMRHVWNIAWFSASAAGQLRSAGTRFGVIAVRTESAKPDSPAIAAAPSVDDARREGGRRA